MILIQLEQMLDRNNSSQGKKHVDYLTLFITRGKGKKYTKTKIDNFETVWEDSIHFEFNLILIFAKSQAF